MAALAAYLGGLDGTGVLPLLHGVCLDVPLPQAFYFSGCSATFYGCFELSTLLVLADLPFGSSGLAFTCLPELSFWSLGADLVGGEFFLLVDD